MNAMKRDLQCVLTPWNPGFIAFGPVRHTRVVMLMVPE
jgi:hypothetical protein